MEGRSCTNVALFLQAKEKEEAILDLLSHRYRVVTGDEDLIWNGAFDIALVDTPSLFKYMDSFKSAKEKSSPILLPVLFVTQRERIGDMGDSLLGVVDDFIITPVEKLELLTRIEAHLKARFLSRDLEKKAFALAERSPISIVIAEAGKITYANPTFAWKLGRTPPALSGENLIDVIHPEDRDTFFKYLVESTIRGGVESPPGEARFTSPKGEVWMEVFCSDIYIGGRKSRVIFGVDVTHRKKDKKESIGRLIQAQKMESLGNLAGNVAHHFNNFLTTMRTYAELILLKNSERADCEKYARRIVETADKAAELSRKLLLLGEGICKEPVVISLNSIVSEVSEEMQDLLPNNVKMTLSLDDELPPVEGDPVSIRKAIFNLVENAIESMPEGGKLAIETKKALNQEHIAGTRSPETREYAAVSISDTGIGIPETDLEKVFEPFYTTKRGGIFPGLGLSVTYRIVQQHGGFINLSSEYGKGSTFTLHFPAAPEREKRKDLLSEHTGKKPIKTKTRILLVEDNVPVREGTAKLLAHAGFSVVEAGSVREALKRYEMEEDEISLILSDVMLPDGRGVELVSRLKEKNPNLKALLVSGYVEEEELLTKIQKMKVPLLSKPYTFKKLLETLNSVLKD